MISQLFFTIYVAGVNIRVTRASVESSLFSFCCLHRSLVILRDRQPSTSAPAEKWDSCGALSVHMEMPTWVVRERDVYRDSLCALTASNLSCAALAINRSCVHPRKKCDFLEVILEDFPHERIQFWDIPSESSPSCLIIISQYFESWYGSFVACALCNLRLSTHFQQYKKINRPLHCRGCKWRKQGSLGLARKRRYDIVYSIATE